ncbi:hypothetical protein HPB52_001834 [Rhipicephalus sanguineus]|uniref:Uncharacterized protein n=1 Tax=Rhipicephalus sanguineus TaxID=34632 RepID=A0A9D4PY97_RHISA|nr:hypothetical protein HPB52_001834 [Rhipicephalus sanguineus]
MDASNHQTRRIGTEQQSLKIPSEEHVNKENKDSGDKFPTQQRLSKGLEDKEEMTNDPETTTGEHTKLEQTLRKMSKIDRFFMKTLLTLAAGAEDNEALPDKLLTEFTKMKSLTLDVTHEVDSLMAKERHGDVRDRPKISDATAERILQKIAEGDTSELSDLSDSDDTIEYVPPISATDLSTELSSEDDSDSDVEDAVVAPTTKGLSYGR